MEVKITKQEKEMLKILGKDLFLEGRERAGEAVAELLKTKCSNKKIKEALLEVEEILEKEYSVKG